MFLAPEGVEFIQVDIINLICRVSALVPEGVLRWKANKKLFTALREAGLALLSLGVLTDIPASNYETFYREFLEYLLGTEGLIYLPLGENDHLLEKIQYCQDGTPSIDEVQKVFGEDECLLKAILASLDLWKRSIATVIAAAKEELS